MMPYGNARHPTRCWERTARPAQAGGGGRCCLQVTGASESVLYRKRPLGSKAQDQWTVPQWVIELTHH